MDTYIWTSSVGGSAPPIGLFHKPRKAGADLHPSPRGTLPMASRGPGGLWVLSTCWMNEWSKVYLLLPLNAPTRILCYATS